MENVRSEDVLGLKCDKAVTDAIVKSGRKLLQKHSAELFMRRFISFIRYAVVFFLVSDTILNSKFFAAVHCCPFVMVTDHNILEYKMVILC